MQKFRWLFGVWENLVFCFQYLLTFSDLVRVFWDVAKLETPSEIFSPLTFLISICKGQNTSKDIFHHVTSHKNFYQKLTPILGSNFGTMF